MKNIRKISLVLVIMFMLVSLAACTKNDAVEDSNMEAEESSPGVEETVEGFPMEIEDDFGNITNIEKKPERIISLAPNNTEILFALGLGEEIVGVTSFCDYPEEALGKEKIGDFNGTNLEKVIELEPDLVINYGPGIEEDNQRLEEAGITVLSYMPESIDEVINTILSIGKATGTEEEAKDLTDNMLAHEEEILKKAMDAEKVKVFYEVWHDPLMTAGPGSFMDNLINLANGENIAADAEGEYPQYDLEQLIERDPQVYLTAADSPEKTVESIQERPGFDDITAIKQGNIHLLDANISSRPGPRIVEGLELVAKAIHPELFE